MAAVLSTSQYKGSDVVYDVCCSICEDDGIYKEGLFNCPKCSKYFCDSCVKTHNKFHKDHSVTAKGEGDIWPDTKTVEDTLELCEIHTTEKLTMFCDDHEKLLCQFCLLHNHRQCSHVVPLDDKIKSATRRMDVDQLSTRIEQLQKRLEDMVKIGEENINSLKTSYERALKEILNARQQINDNLDRLQQTTERNLEQLHSSLKASLENVSKQCVEFVSKLRSNDTKGTQCTSLERSFIMHRKCFDHSASANSFLQNVTRNLEINFERNKDLEQFLASCRDLGKITSHEAVSPHRLDPNTVVSLKDKSQYKVRTPTDKTVCGIIGICESSNGEFILADINNQCVKLLDQAYNVIEQIQLPSRPWSMCKISINEIAVTVSDARFVNEINFLRVDKGRIVKFKTLQLKCSCYGIAIHQSDLFVTSEYAVYQHTMDGRMVKELYQQSSGYLNGLGVSPDGKRIYVTDNFDGKLLALTRDGAVTSTLDIPAFKCTYIECNLHVAATGQVFVFGNTTVSQLDTDGKTVLKTSKMKIDTFTSTIVSVYFSKDTSKMIVGFKNNDNVLEFKTKMS